MGRVQASATIVSAARPAEHYDPSESFWWQDAWSFRFGGQDWTLELEVTVPGQAPYKVAGEWKVPNKLWKLSKSLDGPGRLTPGMVLPVTVDSSDPAQGRDRLEGVQGVGRGRAAVPGDGVGPP